MNTYLIIEAIEAASQFEDVAILDFKFQSEYSYPNGVVVSREIKAACWQDAVDIFNAELPPVLDALALHRLSAISAYGANLIVSRPDLNVALVFLSDKQPGVGLALYGSPSFEDHVKEIEEIVTANDQSLYFFRHASLSLDAMNTTFNLLQCAENIAGDVRPPSKCPSCGAEPLNCKECKRSIERPLAVDKSRLKKLLGKDLYEYYYGYDRDGNTRRNKLMHGKNIDSTELSKKVDLCVEKLKSHYFDHYRLKKTPNIRGFRGLVDSSHGYQYILQYRDTPPNPFELLRLTKENGISSDTNPGLLPSEQSEAILEKF